MTTLIVIFLLAGAAAYAYLRRSAKAVQATRDEALRAARADQADMTRKALGTRPPRHDE